MPFNFLVLLLILIAGCGVREPGVDAGKNPQSVPGGSSVDGVILTTKKMYLVKPSRMDFQIASRFEVQYRFVDRDLEVLKSSVTLKVFYWMPDMPQMPVTPAHITPSGDGKFTVVYDISMEGRWEFKLELIENGTSLDSLLTNYEVQPLS